jgi:hypothetical protein
MTLSPTRRASLYGELPYPWTMSLIPCQGDVVGSHVFQKVRRRLERRRAHLVHADHVPALFTNHKSTACNVSARGVHTSRLRFIGGRCGGIGTPPKEEAHKLKVRPIALIPKNVMYAVATMYRIGRDNTGTTLMCCACTHTERIHDFKRSIGNARTLAAQAMLKHVHSEHSHEIHLRTMAAVMERQHAPR